MCATGTFVLLLLVVGTSAGTFSDFVTGFGTLIGYAEEAPYTLIKQHRHFSERAYPHLSWVCTTTGGPSESAFNDRTIFLKLLRYVAGRNSHHQVMLYAVPATIEYTYGEDGNNNYTYCFYLETFHQADPPEPLDKSLFIDKRNATTIYTRTVGGYISSESEWIDEAARLSGYLQNEGISVTLHHMYWVSYDMTFKFWNRRNEVWFAEETEQ